MVIAKYPVCRFDKYGNRHYKNPRLRFLASLPSHKVVRKPTQTKRTELVSMCKKEIDAVIMRAARHLGSDKDTIRALFNVVVDACDLRDAIECYGKPKRVRQALATVSSKMRRNGKRPSGILRPMNTLTTVNSLVYNSFCIMSYVE